MPVKPSALGYLILLVPEFHQCEGPYLWRVVSFGKNGHWSSATGPLSYEQAKRERQKARLRHKRLAGERSQRSAKRKRHAAG